MVNQNVDGAGRVLSGPLFLSEAYPVDTAALEGTERLLTWTSGLPEGANGCEVQGVEAIYNSALNSAGAWNDPTFGNHQYVGRAVVRAIVVESALKTQAATAAATIGRPIGVFRGWTLIKNSSGGGSVQLVYFPLGIHTRAQQGGIVVKFPENPAWGVYVTAFAFGRVL